MKSGYPKLTIIFCCMVFATAFTHAQSTSQNFPTPVSSNEIIGTIKARDIGDSRLTSYFYAVEASQGDLFVNIVTRNFTGDIDFFLPAGLRSLTKVVVYSDLSENETGRLIYLRKTEKLLLRIQGRTPNDDPASFKIKFAGSFIASNDTGTAAEPELPKVAAQEETNTRVNSVGTIIGILPRPTPSPKDTLAASIENSEKQSIPLEKTEGAESFRPEISEAAITNKTPELIISDNLPDKEETVASRRKRAAAARSKAKKLSEKETQTLDSETKISAVETAETPKPKPIKRNKREPKEKLPDPLENIRLVILFKDGSIIERPMSEVFKFSVDKGLLTVISKTGTIGRYSILDVAKVTIE
ncbi:MAG: hypothetical protein M3Q26_00290 [Acidobacteriota bacterium]|nr:hypothetical protein [Acidobacteriota bacterium]